MASGYVGRLRQQANAQRTFRKRYFNALKKADRLKAGVGQIVDAVRVSYTRIIPKAVFGGTSKSFSSNFDRGIVSLNLSSGIQERQLLDDVRIDDIMRKIKNQAVKNAPIDKRYIGIKPIKPMSFDVASVENLSEREKGVLSTSKTAYYGRVFSSQKEKKQIDFFEFSEFSIEKQRQIKNLLTKGIKIGYNPRTGKRETIRADKRDLWYDESNKSLNLYYASKERFKPKDYVEKMSHNLMLATSFGSNKRHEDEEELRRSAEYDEKKKEISFDPTRMGTRFNYAALQHDNLAFKHDVGGALYLYNAYKSYREKLISAINEVLTEKIGNRKAIINASSGNQDINAKSKANAKLKINTEVAVSKQNLKSVIRKFI